MHFPFMSLPEPLNRGKLSWNRFPVCRARFQHTTLLNAAAAFWVEGLFLLTMSGYFPKLSDEIPTLAVLGALCI